MFTYRRNASISTKYWSSTYLQFWILDGLFITMYSVKYYGFIFCLVPVGFISMYQSDEILLTLVNSISCCYSFLFFSGQRHTTRIRFNYDWILQVNGVPISSYSYLNPRE